MKYIEGYKSLKVYQRADELVLLIYKYTKDYLREELFGLVSQMRRSAISVVANIVEGWARKTKKEKLNFYYTARGSLTELEYYIDLSLKLNYLTDQQYRELAGLRQEVGKLLQGLINSLSK